MNLHRIAACCLAGAAGLALPVGVAVPAAAGGGCHAEADEAPTEASGTRVALEQCRMSPAVLHADVGSTVTFVNEDPMGHNVLGQGWGTDALLSGATFTHAFDEPGTYAYACTIHPGMVGVVSVGDGGSRSVAAPATLPVSSESSGSDGGMGGVGVGAVAVVAFAAGAGAVGVAARRRARSAD